MYIPSDPKVWSEIQRDPFIKKSVFWIPLLGAALIAYGIPEDIFNKFPLLGEAVGYVSGFIPSIDKWSERSNFPTMTRLLFVYLWIIASFYTFLVATHKPYESRFVTGWVAKGQLRHVMPLLLILFVAFFALFAFYIAFPRDQNCSRLCIYESKSLQLLVGGCMTLGIGSIFATIYWWVKNFKVIHFANIDIKGIKQNK